MKRSLTLVLCGLAWGAASAAEPPRKHPTAKGVDLEAASKATAALYAPAPSAPAPAVLKKVPAVPVPVQSVRSAPLLPPTAPAPAPASLGQEAPVQQAVGEVWAGVYQCEQAQRVSLRPGAAADQVELQWKTQRWQMRQVGSRSGAMRLEDASARMVWIQLGNKSMLLDQVQGKRLLDECQHDVQVETAARMKTNPPPALFDTTGMGR